MQENPSPDSPITPPKGLSTISLIGLLFTALIIISVGIVVFSKITSRVEWRSGRMIGMSCPVETEDLTIASIKTAWKSSEGDERLSLRTKYYPVANITLEDIKGEGTIFFVFKNGKGVPVGEMLAVRFNQEGFISSSDPCLKVDGKSVSVIHEGGFNDKDDYYLHCIDESQPYWSIHVAYKMLNSSKRQDVGFVGIATEQ